MGGVRKGSACPSGSGKPPAEGAVAFSSWPQGRVGSILCLLLFFGGEISRFSRQYLETAPMWLPCPSQYTSAFSAGVLPIRIRKASRRGRGGVFELPKGWVGSILCLLLFFEGERSRFSRSRQYLETAPIWLPCPSQYTSAFSAGVLPIRIRKASRRGRGGVFELATGVGRFHTLPPPFFRGGRYPDSAGQGSFWKRLRCGCLPPPNTPLRSLRSLREFSPSGAAELSLSANEIFGRARASERLGGGGGVDVL